MTERTVNLLVTCEDCSVTHTFDYQRSNREAEKAARARGWRVKGNRALCPKHKQIQSAFREHARSTSVGALR